MNSFQVSFQQPRIHSFSTEAFSFPDLCNQSKWTCTNFVPSCCFSLVENVLERRLQNFSISRGVLLSVHASIFACLLCGTNCKRYKWDRNSIVLPVWDLGWNRVLMLAAVIAVLAIKFHILSFKSSWYSQYMPALSGGGGGSDPDSEVWGCLAVSALSHPRKIHLFRLTGESTWGLHLCSWLVVSSVNICHFSNISV